MNMRSRLSEAEGFDRIDPDGVPGMFERANLAPGTGRFWGEPDGDRPCVCLVSALAFDRLGGYHGLVLSGRLEDAATTADAANLAARALTLPVGYVYGLIEGWDGSGPHSYGPSLRGERGLAAGLADGAAARVAVKTAGMFPAGRRQQSYH